MGVAVGVIFLVGYMFVEHCTTTSNTNFVWIGLSVPVVAVSKWFAVLHREQLRIGQNEISACTFSSGGHWTRS
jgi:hypothetical protein